jgi:hypothetical protein
LTARRELKFPEISNTGRRITRTVISFSNFQMTHRVIGTNSNRLFCLSGEELNSVERLLPTGSRVSFLKNGEFFIGKILHQGGMYDALFSTTI